MRGSHRTVRTRRENRRTETTDPLTLYSKAGGQPNSHGDGGPKKLQVLLVLNTRRHPSTCLPACVVPRRLLIQGGHGGVPGELGLAVGAGTGGQGGPGRDDFALPLRRRGFGVGAELRRRVLRLRLGKAYRGCLLLLPFVVAYQMRS